MGNKQLESLKKSGDFSVLKLSGRKRVITPWLMVSYKKTDLGKLRFGITVPKKVGTAVQRNKLKRWCRELVRDLSKIHTEISFDINFIFRSVNSVSFHEISFAQFKTAAVPVFESIFKSR